MTRRRQAILEPVPSRPPGNGMVPFAALFVLSGASALVYEIVWSRYLAEIFGVTAFAVSTVLVSFMGGMAAGAALLGRRAERVRRPLRLFALLEAGIGAYALLMPAVLAGVDGLYAWLDPVLPQTVAVRSLVRVVLSVGALGVPAVLMGGTLPALGQGLLRHAGSIGRGVGLLYFVNTLGAALGCYVAGFHLIPALGLRGTVLLAAAVNGAVAATAWWLDLRREAPEETAAEHVEHVEREASFGPPLTVPAAWPLIVAAGSGMAALAFEVVWFRVLVLSFGSTVYSLSAMLSVFLTGLAIGSIVAGRWVDRSSHPVRLLAWTQGAVAALALGAHLSVNAMPGLFLRIIAFAGFDLAGMNRTKLLLSILTLLPPAVAFGATFPVAVRLYAARGIGIGSRIGQVYAWNTVGAIVGSFGAGFVLLPIIGAEAVLRIVIGVALVLAFGSLLAEPGAVRRRWALPAGFVLIALVGAVAFAPRWDHRLLGAGVYFQPRKFMNPEGRPNLTRVLADLKLEGYTEGYNDTIVSYSSPESKIITINGSTTASNKFEDMFSQRMMGHLSMALHPGPTRRVAIVGLGAGVTAGAMALYDADEITVVELEAGVLEASRFFERENHDVLGNPRVRVVVDDGRSFLKLTTERFDVISSHPNFPSLTGSGALFSRDYLELARSRLTPGGVMVHYAPTWRLLPEDLATIVGTFTDVFPHVRAFSAGITIVLLGRNDPFPAVDIAELTRRLSDPVVEASLAEVGVHGPEELLSLFLFDEDGARRLSEGAPRTSDDRPRIEFSAPRGLFSETVGRNLERLRSFRPPVDDRLAMLGLGGEVADSRVAAAARTADAVMDAQIALARGESREGIELAVEVAERGHRFAAFLVADWAVDNAQALQARGDLEGAREAFVMALRFDATRIEALIGLGYVDLFLGRLDEAQEVLVRATQLYPGSGWAQMSLGLVAKGQGDLDEAERRYRRAIEMQPLLAEPHGLLGEILLQTGRPGVALSHLEAAVRLGNAADGLLAGRVDALLSTGHEREALKRAREAADLHPGSPAVLEVLARAAEARGRTEEAERARRRLRELEAIGH